MHRTDARAIDRRCQALGIEELPRTGQTEAVSYMLTPSQVRQLGEPLPRGAVVNGAGSSDLRQAKLREEVEHLRLKNRKLRAESTPNRIVAMFLREAKDAIPDLIEARLDRYAVDAAGREPAEIRSIGRVANDEIRAGIDDFLKGWIPRFEAE